MSNMKEIYKTLSPKQNNENLMFCNNTICEPQRLKIKKWIEIIRNSKCGIETLLILLQLLMIQRCQFL